MSLLETSSFRVLASEEIVMVMKGSRVYTRHPPLMGLQRLVCFQIWRIGYAL